MKIISTSIFVALAIFFTACAETKDNEGTTDHSEVKSEDNKAEIVTPEITTQLEEEKTVKEAGDKMTFTPFNEHANFLTNTLIEQTCELKHKEICEDGGVSGGVQVKVCYFAPPGWDYDLAYCQVNYISEEAKEYTHFIFYPDENGLLNNEQFAYIEEADLPCIDCQLKDIQIENDEVVGVFYDFMGPDTDTFKMYMNYNFAEMLVSWYEK